MTRILYSFPLRLGAGRICYTALKQVEGYVEAGARVTVLAGSATHVPDGVDRLVTTLARGRARVPLRVIGTRRGAWLHDRRAASFLKRHAAQFDAVHAWPTGALRTLEAASTSGVTTFLERPNAHTRLAYARVEDECRRIGVSIPPGSEHAFDARVLAREEDEYRATDYLLCPSKFVMESFLAEGFPDAKLLRHRYGYDPKRFKAPADVLAPSGRPLSIAFVGYAAVRKGLHTALDAWLSSRASATGSFYIAGEILPTYRDHLASRLGHRSVTELGPVADPASLLAAVDALVLPSVEEGFGLVCVEAMACGAIPLVSDACTDECRHGENSLVHEVGDVRALTGHLDLLESDRELLTRLRQGALRSSRSLTWSEAGRHLTYVVDGHVSDGGC